MAQRETLNPKTYLRLSDLDNSMHNIFLLAEIQQLREEVETLRRLLIKHEYLTNYEINRMQETVDVEHTEEFEEIKRALMAIKAAKSDPQLVLREIWKRKFGGKGE